MVGAVSGIIILMRGRMMRMGMLVLVKVALTLRMRRSRTRCNSGFRKAERKEGQGIVIGLPGIFGVNLTFLGNKGSGQYLLPHYFQA